MKTKGLFMILVIAVLARKVIALNANDELIDIGDVDIEIITEEHMLINDGGSIRFQGSVELGFVDILSHNIQFGQNGTEFDYVEEGGQNILFPFIRWFSVPGQPECRSSTNFPPEDPVPVR